MEAIIAFVFMVVVLGIGVAVLVLPLIALARTQSLPKLLTRVEQLERHLRQLSNQVERLQPGAAAEEIPVLEEVEEAIPTALEVTPQTAAAREQPPARPAPPRRRPPPRPEPSAVEVEARLGGQLLGWTAVVLLICAVGFFLKVIIEMGLLGELERVILAVVVGTGLCGAGYRVHRKGWPAFAQMLTSAGVVILYLASYATFGFYRLLPQDHAAIFLIVLVALTFALALAYEALAIALMAVIGGLLTPLLLASEQDRYPSLFLYLTILNVGVLALAYLRRWKLFVTVALAGTQGVFWLWYAANFHPEKMPAALLFQVTLTALHLGQSIVAYMLGRRAASVEYLLRTLLNALLFTVAGFVLLDPDYHAWLGSIAVGLAILYTALAYLVQQRRPEDGRQLAVLVAVAMSYVAMTIPLQADARWIALGWSAQALVLWWFGLRLRAEILRIFSGVLFSMAVLRLCIADLPYAHAGPFIPVLNGFGVPAVLVTVTLMAASLLCRRYHRASEEGDVIALRAVGLAGVGLLWLILSVETYTYFTRQISPDTEAVELRRTAQMSLSVLWAVYAALMLAVGFRLPSPPLRWLALGLFAVTLGKVVLVDMAGLPGLYRVAAFLALSLMMGAGAWGYQKLKRTLLVPEPKEAQDETV